MPSKTSYFNRTLYQKLLSRFWPLWAGIAALASLVPLVTLMELTNPYAKPANFDADQIIYTLLLDTGPAFMMIYAVITAMAVWGYLYTARSVSLMHTLPVTRVGLFVTGCAAGFTILLLPMAIAGLLLMLVLLPFGLAPWAAAAHCALGLTLLALQFFGFATLCAMVTGHMLALPVFYFIGSFIAPLLDALLSTFASSFLFGVITAYSGAVDWLSPVMFIYEHTDYTRSWSEETQLWSSQMEGMGVLAVYGLAGLALLALALLIYLRRPSESAGDVVSLPLLRPIFKLGVGVMAGVSFGQVIYELLSITAPAESLLRMGVCMALMGAAGFWIADMLVQKSLRVWRTTAVGAAVMAVLSLSVCLGVHLDLLGIERRIPDREDLVSITVSGSAIRHQSVTLYAGGDDAYLEQLLGLHQTILDSKSDIQAMADADLGRGYYAGRETPPDQSHVEDPSYSGEDPIFHSLTLEYRLKDGSVLRRRYSLPITQTLLNTPDSYAVRLSALVNEPELRLKRLYYGRGYNAYYASIRCETALYLESEEDGENYEVFSMDLEGTDAQRIYQAVIEDAKAGRWGEISLLRDDSTRLEWLTIHLELHRARQEDSERTDYVSLYIVYTPDMTATAQAMLDAGVSAAALEPPAD